MAVGVILFSVFALLLFCQSASAYVAYNNSGKGGGGPDLHTLDLVFHDVSNVKLIVSNQGVIGNNIISGNGTGFFPANTDNNYVFGTGLWFGARYDADADGNLDKVFTQGYNPLAGDSEFREGTNEQNMNDPLARIFDSTVSGDIDLWPDEFKVDDEVFVRSDQDLVTTYTTRGKSAIIGEFQMPLQVNQRSMAFKNGLAAQAIFFILDIDNWGNDVLADSWVGYDSDMDVGVAFADDLTSFVVNRANPEGGDSIRVNMAYAWDAAFSENNFTGIPGFVGIAYLRSPGNPNDGIDNDMDGLIDESPYNGEDDDGDGKTDEADEVDELGLVNYSKHCNPSAPCEINDPELDEDGYDLLACLSDNNPDDTTSQYVCLESVTPADIRFYMSSGPFDWAPGQTQQVVLAMVFAKAIGDPSSLPFEATGRPDPNHEALSELMRVKDVVQGVFDLDFLQPSPPVAPNMTLVPGNGKVTILWDDLSIRTSDRVYEEFVLLDPDYLEFDFQGYRLYRSRTGIFSDLGRESIKFPFTPEAIQQNEENAEYDLTLLGQWDLADGITTESDGTVCSDSMVLIDSSVVYTDCDTFNLGTDTGLQFAYVDRGDDNDPLINGFRYFYSVTAYDVNSYELTGPLDWSLDSGVSFPAENSVIPRSNASGFVNAFGRFQHLSSDGELLDDTSSIFVSAATGELEPPDSIRASNAVADFVFNPGIYSEISDAHYEIVLDDFERLDDVTNRITYHVEDADGDAMHTGSVSSFDLSYDGTEQIFSAAVMVLDDSVGVDSAKVFFTSEITFDVDQAAFVTPVAEDHFLAENSSGVDIVDSLGNISFSVASFIPAGFRAADLRMEWTAVDDGDTILTLVVSDLDNLEDVAFGDSIVVDRQVIDAAKGSNWSFLPVSGGVLQPGGRYLDITSPVPIADLWLCGYRITLTGMSRMPMAGDAWTVRQLAYTVDIDTLVTPNDTTYSDARRPPVPGARYRIDTQSGGQEKGDVDLTKIRVVPNPYIATSSFELGPTEKQIHFINLPSECTIRIYTISGNLVNTLEHTLDEAGTEVYDLRTRYNLELASGNYYYHVTTPNGETHLGRFAVVQ
jgi:hypothetical protein